MAKVQAESKAADGLMAALDAVTADALADVDARVAAKRAEADQVAAAYQAEIGKLLAVRKVVAAKLGVKAERKKREPKPKPAGNPPHPGAGANGVNLDGKRRKVLTWLKANRPVHVDVLSEKVLIGRPGPHGLAAVLQYEWFHVDGDGVVSLTDKGDRAYPAY
jgi:hypothetical protein